MATKDYVGEHSAPCPESGAPIHNPIGVYPKDFYDRMKDYSDGYSFDHESSSVFHHVKGNPRAAVKIYRAVPKVETHQEKIDRYEGHKKYILKFGKVPPDADAGNYKNSSAYYDHASNKLEDLKSSRPESEPEKMKINAGDWVTASRSYAKDHGQSNLNNKYKIISKTVKASELYTSGDSIHELGYHPSKPASLVEAYMALRNSH